MESIVVEFNDDINLTRMLRAAPKGCVSPYTPWYPVALTRIPKGYNWMSPQASQAAHFFVDNEELVYNPEKAFWAFKVLLYFTEFDYKGTHAVIEEEIAKLEEKAMGASIKAPVSGTVTTLAYVAGETTKPDQAAAIIQMEGKGFTVSFAVTNEQAKKVKVGDVAELQNAWYYDAVLHRLL